MSIIQDFDLNNLDRLLRDFCERPQPLNLDTQLPQLIQALRADQLDLLPLPGQGSTLRRWQTLARVAGCDLALAKLYEGHTDAMAILAECGATHLVADGIWGVWAAEPPDARAQIVARDGDSVRLAGRKAWCSGALQIDRALITAWAEDDQPQLVAIELSQPSQGLNIESWQAVGMGTTASIEVTFDNSLALPSAAPGNTCRARDSGMAAPVLPPVGTVQRKPWRIICAPTVATRTPTSMPRLTSARSMPPCMAPAPHCANVRTGSISTPTRMPVSRYAAPAPRWSRRSTTSSTTSAGHWARAHFAATVISPASVPTCRSTCARAMPNGTWPRWASRSRRCRQERGNYE